MAKAVAIYKDAQGKRSSITSMDCTSAAKMKTYADAVAKYSDAAVVDASYTENATITAKKPDAASNVDRKGIVICQDEKRRVHKLTIPSLKSGQIIKTPNGERLTTTVVEGMGKAFATLTGLKITALYGYPIQVKTQ